DVLVIPAEETVPAIYVEPLPEVPRVRVECRDPHSRRTGLILSKRTYSVPDLCHRRASEADQPDIRGFDTLVYEVSHPRACHCRLTRPRTGVNNESCGPVRSDDGLLIGIPPARFRKRVFRSGGT